MLTQSRLKEKLNYDPESGLFSALVARRGIQKVGNLRSDGYIQTRVDGKDYLAHRLAFLYMTGAFPVEDTDHINGICDDNRWNNLRSVTHMENQKNQRRPNTNTSGVVGVHWHKSTGKWMAYIWLKGKKMHLGLFANFFDAVCVRKSAEDRYGFHINHGRIK